MKYLDAIELTENFHSKKKIEINLISSFYSNPINIFLKAFFAKKKIDLTINNNQFNTLKQTLISIDIKKDKNILIVCPWDFCEKLNWRLGLNNKINYFEEARSEIDYFFFMLKNKKKGLKLFYFDAPAPKNLLNSNENSMIKNYISLKVSQLNCSIFLEDYFDIVKYFDLGFPFKTDSISKVALTIFNKILAIKTPNKIIKKEKIVKKDYETNTKKILATDFDGVLWKGIIAEDGYKNIHCGNDATGYKYFLYQSLIKKLISRGIIIIGVTRNKLEVAKKGFLNKECLLNSKDFIKIYATYNNKSEMIKESYKSLNLSMNSVVFVDDNIIEVSEVKKNLPKVETLIYPRNDYEFPKFIEKINNLFQKNYILKEDKLRLKNYKNIKNLNKKSNYKSKFDLNQFLSKLKMNLQIHQKKFDSKHDLIRPFQLINKTNQFNLNGLRLSKIKFNNILKNGGKIFSGTYSDKSGDYGEIIALLMDKNSNVISYVMSCRVFQRNIEFAFIYFLIKNKIIIKKFNFKKTSMNLPMQDFFTKIFNKYLSNDQIFINKNHYLINFKKLMSNFRVKFHKNLKS